RVFRHVRLRLRLRWLWRRRRRRGRELRPRRRLRFRLRFGLRLGLRLGLGLRLWRNLLHRSLGDIPKLYRNRLRRTRLPAHTEEENTEQEYMHGEREQKRAAEPRLLARIAFGPFAHCATLTCRPTFWTPWRRSSSIT